MIACSCLASALLAVGGMTNGVQIARTPVTNAEYAEFANATGHSVPRYWKNGTFAKGRQLFSISVHELVKRLVGQAAAALDLKGLDIV